MKSQQRSGDRSDVLRRNNGVIATPQNGIMPFGNVKQEIIVPDGSAIDVQKIISEACGLQLSEKEVVGEIVKGVEAEIEDSFRLIITFED